MTIPLFVTLTSSLTNLSYSRHPAFSYYLKNYIMSTPSEFESSHLETHARDRTRSSMRISAAAVSARLEC